MEQRIAQTGAATSPHKIAQVVIVKRFLTIYALFRVKHLRSSSMFRSSPRCSRRYRTARLLMEELESRFLLSASGPTQALVPVMPNDPLYGQEYGLTKIQAEQAWTLTTGSSAVVVADLDSGVDYTHHDLYQHVWIKQNEVPAPGKAAILSQPGWDVDGDGRIGFKDLNDPSNQGIGKIIDQDNNHCIDALDLLADWNQDGTGGWADAVDQDPFTVTSADGQH